MRLIDADELLETGYGARIIVSEHKHPYDAVRRQGNAFEKAVKVAPTVDAVPVVHGRWNARDIIAKQAGYGQRYYNHAECKVNPCELFKAAYDYCPNCGAKMDGGNDNG